MIHAFWTRAFPRIAAPSSIPGPRRRKTMSAYAK